MSVPDTPPAISAWICASFVVFRNSFAFSVGALPPSAPLPWHSAQLAANSCVPIAV